MRPCLRPVGAVRLLATAVLLCAFAGCASALFFNTSAELPGIPSGCTPVPGITQSDQLCADVGFTNAQNLTKKCDTLATAQLALLFGTSNAPCNASAQVPAVDVSKSGHHLPYPLHDARKLKPTLPQWLVDKEGASLYWLYRVNLNFRLWASCAATSTPQTVTPGIPTTGNPARDFLVPAGWTPYSTLWLADGGATGLYTPFAAILYKDKQVLVLIRGTQTGTDWLIDFDYGLSPATESLPLPGQLHRGFYGVAATLWPGLRSALFNLRNEHGIQNVYIAGHSLGAGVSALLAYAAQTYLDDTVPADGHYGYGGYDDGHYGGHERDGYDGYERDGPHYAEAASTNATEAYDDAEEGEAEPEGYHHRRRGHKDGAEGYHRRGGPKDGEYVNPEDPERHRHPKGAKVDAALFAPPDVGDATFAAAFAERVNGRRIAFLYDLIPQVPCSPNVACPKPPVFVNASTGVAGANLWPYYPLPGGVTLLPSGMATNQIQWSYFTKPYLCELARFAEATHVCSYLCYFSKYVNDLNNLCLLRATPSTGGTWCYEYPSTTHPDYPFAP